VCNGHFKDGELLVGVVVEELVGEAARLVLLHFRRQVCEASDELVAGALAFCCPLAGEWLRSRTYLVSLSLCGLQPRHNVDKGIRHVGALGETWIR
jgi:hypothetical protein